jgi:ABC-type nickel/cobalt efflux system permease component RcnA
MIYRNKNEHEHEPELHEHHELYQHHEHEHHEIVNMNNEHHEHEHLKHEKAHGTDLGSWIWTPGMDMCTRNTPKECTVMHLETH